MLRLYNVFKKATNMQNDDHIVEIKSEQNDFYSNDDIYKINSWGADLSFRELIQLYDEDNLVKPELQRKYVWDKTEASRFVDSILLGLPVPSIFLSKQPDEKMLIVDGYQRIMTVRDYVKGIFSTDNKIFRLSNSEKINARWRGKAFAELSDSEKLRINNKTIHAIIFVQDQPKNNDTGMYQVFERINTSGRTLQPQEIRNCVYQGEFNTLLFKLNKLKVWRSLFGRESEDPRMRDLEFILRFLAMVNIDFKKVTISAISLKKFLNEFMGNKDNNTIVSLKKFSDQFETTSTKVLALIGNEAFYNVSQEYKDKLVNKFNPTIFDSIMIATYLALKRDHNFPKRDYIKNRIELLNNDKYQSSISVRTTNIENIKKRISLAMKYLYNLNYAQL